MADDDPTRIAALQQLFIRIVRKLRQLRDLCQDQLARIAMTPPDYDTYTTLTRDLHSKALQHDEFQDRITTLLQRPIYRHLLVYWVDYHRSIKEGRQLLDSPLYTFPILQYISSVSAPIPQEQIAELRILVDGLWNLASRQNHMTITHQVREQQMANRQEGGPQTAPPTESADRQDLATQQRLVSELQIAWQLEQARKQQIAWDQETAKQRETNRMQEMVSRREIGLFQEQRAEFMAEGSGETA